MGQNKKAGPGFGYGTKGTDLMVVKSLRDSVTPLRYNLPSTNTKISTTFGQSREKCKSIKAHLNMPDHAVPGPGTYKSNNPNLDMNFKRTNVALGPMEFSTKSTDLFSEVQRLQADQAPHCYYDNYADITSITSKKPANTKMGQRYQSKSSTVYELPKSNSRNNYDNTKESTKSNIIKPKTPGVYQVGRSSDKPARISRNS